MSDAVEWDGRVPFYPQVGYEKDAEFMEMYTNFLEKEGLDSRSDERSESSEDYDDGDNGGGLPRRIIYEPPVYDRRDHLHHLCSTDERKRMMSLVCPELKKIITAQMMPRRMRSKDTPFEVIGKEVLSNIMRNRKENPSVKETLRSTVVLEARIAGIGEDAPKRLLEVPGNLILAGLYDRVLCPAFGWTRGYHDYRFYVPPTGYKDGPPQCPYADVVFGAVDTGVSIQRNHGFWNTLRCDPQNGGAVSVSDTNVCIADLLQGTGQEIRHVLGTGWVTSLKVSEITPRLQSDRNSFGKIRSGAGPNLPERISMSIEFSEYDEHECGGPKAFALAHEMIRRSDADPRSGWMRESALRRTACKASDFDLSRPFDLTMAQNTMNEARKGELTPNPEHSKAWMMSMFGAGPLFPRGTEMSQRGEFLVPAGACNFCNVPAEQLQKNLQVCSRCKNVQYCSRECQVSDWKSHKKLCITKKKNT